MLARVGVILILIFHYALTGAIADELQDYAMQCDKAVGTTVPDFDCDAGTEVPGEGSSFQDGAKCDEPNRLNGVCDPGSRFQVLTRSDTAFVVAHCRKEGGPSGAYGDIAVIQTNRINGATCFYQALGNQQHGNLPGGSSTPGDAPGDKPVTAPSKGLKAFVWLSPSSTARIGCGGCHDNGAIIRSPYLNQVTGNNELPGARDSGFNSDQLYAFVGNDFASWKAYQVEVSGNECNDCHRLGVNNVHEGWGTALDFGMRATSATEQSKNPPSAQSPIWMPPHPVQLSFNQKHADAAKAVHDCASRWQETPMPNSDACKITPFAGPYTQP